MENEGDHWEDLDVGGSYYTYNGSVVGIAASLNNLYNLPEDGHQIGRNILR
jgi:hypothetical protein